MFGEEFIGQTLYKMPAKICIINIPYAAQLKSKDL